jgi:hypothetical protein
MGAYRGGYCGNCGNLVRREGHEPDCPSGRCRRCGVQCFKLASASRKLCADCASLDPDDDPRGLGLDGNGERGAAVLICYSGTTKNGVTMTAWPSLDQAIAAATEFPVCRPDCIGVHDVATKIDGRIRILHAAPLVVRRNIQLALGGDQAAIARLRHRLNNLNEGAAK